VRRFRDVMVPALLLLAGCEHKTSTVLTGDTALEMQSSIQTLADDLPPERQEEFRQAVATIVFSSTDRRLAQNGDRLTPQSIKTLKGLNVGQVIETAKLLHNVSANWQE